MSSSIENNVVSMSFDNSNFEANAEKSIGTLGKLQQALKIDGSGLDNISSTAKGLNFDGLSSACQTVTDRFSTLGIIGMTALQKITDAAIDTGAQLVKSLSIDQITAGYSEYELKMDSVNTIMASTGEDIGTVSKYLEELNQYADKTIYSFSDMTSNIGKFTNAGIDLDTSVAAMKGISNWAAVAGANSNEASRAMYNLSQSIAGGYVQLIDWKSVKLANMATQDVMKNIADTAVAMGALKKNADGTFNSFTTNNKGDIAEGLNLQQLFNEGLQYQWFTNDIFMKTMSLYSTDIRDMTDAEKEAYKERINNFDDYKKKLREQGYTEEQISKHVVGFTQDQIDSFMDLSVKANDSATIVKTFSQLMDTLKESVGSGWAMTFEYIFGDLEEAKILWTEVNNRVGGAIGTLSDGRNELLKGWKELGGRDQLLKGLSDLWDNLSVILKTVREAFREVFPKKTSQDLFDLTKRFTDFVSNLKMGDSDIKNFKDGLLGIFTLLSKAKDYISQLSGPMSDGFNTIQRFTEQLLELFGNFGRSVTTGEEFTIPGLDKTKELLGSALPVFEEFFDKVGKGIDVIKEKAKGIFDFIAGIFTTKELDLSGIDGIFSSLALIIENVWKGFKKLSDTIKPIIEELFSRVDSTIQRNGGFMGVLQYLIDGGIIMGVIDMITKLKNVLDPLDDIGDMITNIREDLAIWQQSLKAEFFIKMAGAIGILAASLWLLSTIDGDKLTTSIAALGGLFAELLVGVKSLTNSASSFSKIASVMSLNTIGSLLIKLGASILLMASAIKIVASLDPEKISIGVKAITAIMAELVAFVIILNKLKVEEVTKGVGSIILLAVAVRVLVGGIKDLADLNADQITNGFAAIGGLLLELLVFVGILSKMKVSEITTGLGGLVLLALSIRVLVGAVEGLGSLKTDTLITGIIAVSVLMGELAVFGKLMSTYKSSIASAGVGMVLMAVALNLLVPVVRKLGEMTVEELLTGGIAIGALLGLATAFSLLSYGNNLTKASAGLLILGIALNTMLVPIKVLGKMDVENLLKAGIAITALLTIVGLFSALTNGGDLAATSAALILFSLAINLLVVPLGLIGAMKAETIVKALLTIFGAIVIFAGASALLAPLIPTMIAFAGALVLFGAGMLAIGAGVLAAGLGLSALAVGIMAVVALGGEAIVAFTGILMQFLEEVFSQLPTLIPYIGETLLAILDLIIENTPKIIDTVEVVLEGILQLIIDEVPAIAGAALVLIIGLLNELTSHAEELIKAGIDLVVALVKGIADSLGDIIDAAFKLVIGFIEGLATAIDENEKELWDAVGHLLTSIVLAIADGIWMIVDAGRDIVAGLAKGIVDNVNKAVEAANELGEKVWQSIKDFFDINSPSKEMAELGMYVDQGFAKGIEDNSQDAANAAEEMGIGTKDALQNSLSGLSSIMDANLELKPVISPVLDLSDAQSKANTLSSMFTDRKMDIEANEMARMNTLNSVNTNTSGYMSSILNAIRNNSNTPVNVNLTLEGDAGKLFKLINDENRKYINRTGRSSFSY